MLESAQAGDHIVVDDFACLGADLEDVAQTLRCLKASRLKLTILSVEQSLGASDTVEAMLATVHAVAAFLKQAQVERVKAGQSRARSAGKAIGRPSKLDAEQQRSIIEQHATGQSIASLARRYRVSRGSIKRIID